MGKAQPLREDQFDALVNVIYEAAFDPGLWPALLDRLLDPFRASSAWFCTFALDAGGPRYSRNVIWNARDPKLAAECAVQQPSPWTRASMERPIGQARRTSDLVPMSELARTAFYHDFVEPLRIHHCVGATHDLGPAEKSIHSIYRPLRKGDFADDEVACFGRLCTHLQRSEIISRRLRSAEATATVGLETLQRLDFGVLLVDRQARPVFVNQAAERLLAPDSGISLCAAELRCWLDADTRTLHELLHDATTGGPGRGGQFAVRQPSGHLLGAFVAPLPRNDLFPGCTAPAAVLFLVDPERSFEPTDAVLVQFLGLSPAEARVAKAVARGGGLAEVAESLGVSRNTVRTQLASIFSKTGTRRQADLARLLSRMFATVRSSEPSGR